MSWPPISSTCARRAGSVVPRRDSAAILQGGRPSLALVMEQRQVSIGHLDAKVRQQVTALGQGKIQVAVPDLVQLTRYPQPVLPQRRVRAAG